MKCAADLAEARSIARERFLDIARALKAEAGVTEHVVRRSLSGYAYRDGRIVAPEGRTRKQLYILAHECAHVLLHASGSKPSHVREMEAEQWAHAALRRHGVPVPREMTARAKRYVARKIGQAKRRGAKTIDPRAARYAKGKPQA